MPKTKPFAPGVIDYDGRMSANYQSGRSLSEEAARTWATIVSPFVPPVGRARILDLGAGTGRFSTLFAQVFQAQVVGVEPSKGMLAVAREGARPGNLAYAAGTAECIPLRGQSCNLAWLSHVWHHIRDHHACVGELRRIVIRDGQVLVRGTFGDQLDGFQTLFQYWPATRAISEQLPTIEQTVSVFEAGGFALTEHRRVQQVTATSLGEFANRTRRRADTALTLISDSAFRKGQLAIERAAARERIPSPVMEVIELLVFQSAA